MLYGLDHVLTTCGKINALKLIIHIYFLRPDKSPLFGTSFYINNQINILQMKKVKTFNQEVEHFCQVLEAEIQKKEC